MHYLNKFKIWQKAIELTTEIYIATKEFPKEELYGLKSQIRRAAVSIPSNISEGAGRNSNNEFVHFLGISNGSTFELQTQIIIANQLMLIDYKLKAKLLLLIDEIQKMNYSLQKKLKG
jgi:four helix bundle protein